MSRKFTARDVHDAVIKALNHAKLEETSPGRRPRFGGVDNFDPAIYPHICIRACSPMVSFAGRTSPDADEDESEKEHNFRVSWRFPVTIEVENASCSFPIAPGPTSYCADISLPSGVLGGSSYSLPRTPTRNGEDDGGAGEDAAEQKNSVKLNVAANWPDYIAAANVLINEVVNEALPSSNYLSFNPRRASGEDHLTISIMDDAANQLGVHISGKHVHGWGNYNRAKKIWSDLRHKHCARDRSGSIDLGILYEGFNDGIFEEQKNENNGLEQI
jgi:hypothetical protein